MSAIESLGLSINLWRPTITVDETTTPHTISYKPKGINLGRLSSEVTGYTHQIAAIGGYATAQLTLDVSRLYLEDWYNKVLSAHVEVSDQTASVVWEGFVNRASLSQGGLQVQNGPVTDAGNRVCVWYSTVDTSTIPPTMGERVRTDYAEDATSQRLHGCLYKIFSSSGMTAANAAIYRDTWLQENAMARRSQTLSLGGGGATPKLVLGCEGYSSLLNYPYNRTTNSGTANLTDKMANVLAADPNGMFTNRDLQTNTLQVTRYENDDLLAESIIKSMVAAGDTSYNRYLFGVYADRKVIYKEAPSVIEYTQRLAGSRQNVQSINGGEIHPWNVQPGKWVQFPDFLVGTVANHALRDDPRMMFIENVTYNAPYSLTLSGGRIDTIAQMIARQGLGGI